MIKPEGSEWVLYSQDGSKVLGRFKSKAEAEAREKEIEAFKHEGEAVAEVFRFRRDLEATPRPDDLTGMEWEVTLIRAGESLNGRTWSRETLAQAVPLFVDRPVGCYTWRDPRTGELTWGHLPDEHFDLAGGGLLRNVSGIIKNPRMVESDLRATIVLDPQEAWLGKKLLWMYRNSEASNFRSVFGLSVDVIREGDRIVRVQSVDLVNGPAAGGALLRAVASAQPSRRPAQMEFILKLIERLDKNLAEKLRATGVKDLDALKQSHADLHGAVMALMEAKGDDGKAKTVETPKSEAKPAGTPKEEPKAEAKPETKAKEEGEQRAAASLTDITRTVKEMEGKLRASEQMLRDRELEALISVAKLPAEGEKHLRRMYAGREWKKEDVEQDIRDTQTMVARAVESVKNENGIRETEAIEVGSEPHQKRVDACAGMLLGNGPYWAYDEPYTYWADGRRIETKRRRITEDFKVAQEQKAEKVIPYRSIKDFYLDFNGRWDPHVSGQVMRSLVRAKENIDTSGWANVLADAFHIAGAKVYRDGDWNLWRRFCNVVPCSDFKAQYQAGTGGYANLSSVAEGVDFPALTSPGDFKTYYTPGQYGGTESITLQAIKNDQTGTVRGIVRNLGRAAARTICETVTDLLKDNSAWTGDSVALLHSNHSNVTATALSSAANLWTICKLLIDQTELTNSKSLGLWPRFLLTGTQRADAASQIVQAEFDFDATSATKNQFTPNLLRAISLSMRQSSGKELPLEILVIRGWSASNTVKHVVIADPADIDGMEVGFVDGIDEPEVVVSQRPDGSNFLAKNNTILYRVALYFGVCARDYRAFAGSTTN